MALIISILLAFGIITSPDNITDQIIQNNQDLLQKEIIIEDIHEI